MAQITITEGLSKLKNLDSRINKEISNSTFFAVFQTGKVPNGYKTVEDFQTKSKAYLQSVTDLIEQRNKIKSAIVASNAVTEITVANKQYTVAGVIERKQSIEFQRQLLQTITNQFTTASRDFDRKSAEIQTKLDNLIEASLGKDAKSNPDDIKSITDNYMGKNGMVLCDPIGAKDIMAKMSNDINDFMTNVDVALSISNATTMIEI